MSKFLKNTSVFVLGLACLVILAHLFIPHDHHTDAFFSDSEGTCSSHSTESPSGLPSHCHAFNDLAFDKGRTSVVINSDLPTSDFHPFEIINSQLAGLSGSTICFSLYLNTHTDAEFQALSHLRAPPSLV